MVCYLLLYKGYTILECNDICILILNLKKWANEKIFIIINFSKPLNLKIKRRLINYNFFVRSKSEKSREVCSDASYNLPKYHSSICCCFYLFLIGNL